jgi:hypothetical protein
LRESRPVVGLLLLAPLLVMTARIDSPLQGHHLFRQAHVAANIDKFVALGPSLVPRTWNLDVPFSLFDFPAYQLLVAELCRRFAWSVLPAARAVNVLVFVLILLVYGLVLGRTRLPGAQRALALLLFASAPINVFYLSSPMVDGLALLAAAVSLWGWVKWEDAGQPGIYAMSLSAGVLATLVKNPVYLPTLLAILWLRFRARGFRGLLGPDLVLLVAALGASVLWFKLLSSAVNGQSELLSRWEGEQYFGPPAERLDPASWGPVLFSLGLLALNPLTLTLALAGAGLAGWRGKAGHEVWLGLLLGSAVTLLVFFHRCRVHSYYLLPFVFPLAVASSHGLRRLTAWWRARIGRRSSQVLPAAVIGATLLSSWLGVRNMSIAEPWHESRGNWIQRLTDPRDFVVYVVTEAEGNWNPEYLYFARRDGYNLWRGRLTRHDLAGLYVRFAGSYSRLFIFSADAESDVALDALGAPAVAAERRRRLYRFEPSWIWPST